MAPKLPNCTDYDLESGCSRSYFNGRLTLPKGVSPYLLCKLVQAVASVRKLPRRPILRRMQFIGAIFQRHGAVETFLSRKIATDEIVVTIRLREALLIPVAYSLANSRSVDR